MSKCRACGAEIVWIKTRNGANMPCDAEEIEFRKGEQTEMFITDDGSAVWGKRARGASSKGRIPHWATCPKASEFHKGRRDNG